MLKPQPRRSRMLDKMRAGGKAISYKMNGTCARLVEVAALSGYDCIWVCMEHTPTDWSTMERQIAAAKMHDVDCLVRVTKGCYSDMVLPLEADASAIMVPHVMSAAEAREIAHWTKFHPIGRRPVDGGNADGLYCLLDFKEYLRFVNENRMVIIQIEDVEALDELEEICAVPGIDMIFFGPADFSHSLGDPGNMSNPEVIAARRKVVEAAHRHGKFAGTTAGIGNLREYYAMGYDFLNCGADVLAVGTECRTVIEAYHKALEN